MSTDDTIELPDWIIEGVRLVQEHEVLQARARAAWRMHCARDAEYFSLAAHQAASRVEQFEKRFHEARASAVIHLKSQSRR